MITAEDAAPGENDEDACRVRTEDATGQVREYRIGLDDMLGEDAEYVMAGSRVDDDAPDDDFEAFPSDAAWDAAREYFEGAGYEVL